MEGVESALLAGIEGPGLATMHRVLSTQAAVHLHLGADGQHGFVQDPLSEMFQCCSAL